MKASWSKCHQGSTSCQLIIKQMGGYSEEDFVGTKCV